jgi:hypothetical protein
MILKEHPLRYTATQVRRSIERLETYREMNPVDANNNGTLTIINELKMVYSLFSEEFRK